MVKLFLWHLGPSTGLVRDDNCLDWNRNKNNTTSVHYRRLALQREADVHRSFRFGSWFLEPSKMQYISPTSKQYTSRSDMLDVRMLDFFLMCSARSEWKLKMKRTSKCENMNNWNAELSFMRVVHFSAYALYKDQQLTFCECLLHLKPLYEHLYVSILSWRRSIPFSYTYSCILVATNMLSLLAHLLSC